MIEEFTQQETKAPFNMALNTLERLGYILSQIRAVSIDPNLPDSTKQKMKVSLVRQFFVQSSPLLDEKVVEKYQNDFLTLKPKTQKVAVRNGGSVKITDVERVVFDRDLEDKLDLLLLSIQRELQKEKYFMPPKKDVGRAVGSFG